jgi:hypothetical protein
VKQRDERNRAFVASLKESEAAARHFEAPGPKIEEIAAEEEEAEEARAKANQRREKMRRLLTVYADCNDKV